MNGMRGKYKVLALGGFVALVVTGLLVLGHAVRQWRWRHAGPIPNQPARVYDVAFSREFNDLNDVQLTAAMQLGIAPLEDRSQAQTLSRSLRRISTGPLYRVDSLTHSIPYLVPQAVGLLERIGTNFLDSLSSKGLNPNKIVVTSVLRTEEDVRRLRRGNTNASAHSTHCYGTTFDLSYWHYEKVPSLRGRPYEDVPPEQLRAVLGQVLKDLHDRKECYVKYEKKQTCFHITVRP